MAERVVLLTGAGRGLGRVMALALLRAGHRVFLTSTDEPSLRETARESGAGERAAFATADLAEERNLPGLVAAAEKRFGRIDILVNNAATPAPRSQQPLELQVGHLRRMFEINTLAPIRLAQLVAPGMIARGWGRLVFLSTSLDTMLAPAYVAYGMTKAADEAFVAGLAASLGSSGVTANVLLPGGRSATRMGDPTGMEKGLLPAEIMGPPMVWLASDSSDGVSGRRFIAARWNANLSGGQAAQAASAPAAWVGPRDTSIQPSTT